MVSVADKYPEAGAEVGQNYHDQEKRDKSKNSVEARLGDLSKAGDSHDIVDRLEHVAQVNQPNGCKLVYHNILVHRNQRR